MNNNVPPPEPSIISTNNVVATNIPLRVESATNVPVKVPVTDRCYVPTSSMAPLQSNILVTDKWKFETAIKLEDKKE